MSIELPANFYLGKKYDLKSHKLLDEPLNYSARDLTTHAVIVGMTGSGKTGLGITLLEEAALDGIPALIIDPKGDLTNLLLTFPQLRPDDFLPWMESDAGSPGPEAADSPVADVSPSSALRPTHRSSFAPPPGEPDAPRRLAEATRVAAAWKAGLAEWGIDGARIQRLRDAVDVTIYTPGSEAGVPVNILDALRVPAGGTPHVSRAAVHEAASLVPAGGTPSPSAQSAEGIVSRAASGQGSADAPPIAGQTLPESTWDADPEDMREKIQGIVSAVLGLIGLETDPLRSREHILLSHLVEQAWRVGRDMDIEQLILGIQNPPLRKLGVFDIDTFFPPKDRFELAMALNAILAAPSFETWLKGVPFDVGSFLYSGAKPRHSIFYIAHLSDAERLFFVSLLLQQVRSWLRAQPGTTNLRALLYFDELFGYLPPYPHNPATKTPLLYLLKNARAYGLGLVLATQNPIDLDYKALTNAGTWFIGKLQTQYDKARLLDGLQTVAGESGGSLNRAELNDALGALDVRVFLYHNVHQPLTIGFQTRWAMSYLKGPLTRPQIRSLMAHANGQLAAAVAERAQANAGRPLAPGAVGGPQTTISVVSPEIAQYYLPPRPTHQDAPAGDTAQAVLLASGSARPALPAAPTAGAAPATLPDDEPDHPGVTFTTLRSPDAGAETGRDEQGRAGRVSGEPARRPSPQPDSMVEGTVADATNVAAGDSSADAPTTPASPAETGVYQPYLLAMATITFDDRRTDTRHSVGEARLLADRNGAPLDWSASETLSLTPKDLQTTPPPHARFAGLPSGFANPQKLIAMQRSFVQYLYRESSLVLRRNKLLKIVESPSETEGAFRQRCAEAARAGLEAEQHKIKTKYGKQLDRLADALQKQQNNLTAEQKDLEGRKHEELWTNIESIGAFLGFGRAYRPLSTASRRRRQTQVTASTIQESRDTIESLKQKLGTMQQDLDRELSDSRAKWVAAQDALEEVKLVPRKSDIHVDAFGIAWRPGG